MSARLKTEKLQQPRLVDEQIVVDSRTINRRRCIFAPIAIFSFILLLLALMTYDWRDIRWLCNPPNDPISNRIGLIGAWLTFTGYNIAGLAYRYFALPLLAILAGFLLHGHVIRFRLRAVWILLLYIVIACLFQCCGANAPLLEALNLRPNSGGALGQWLVTDLLHPLIGTVGLQILLWPLSLLLFVLIVGGRNCVLFIVRITAPCRPQPQASDDEDIRDTLRRKAETMAQEESTEPVRGFFARLFHRPTAPKEKEDVRDLLAQKNSAHATSSQTWFRPPVDNGTDSFLSPQRKTVASPISAPLPEPPPLVLASEEAPLLKPVSIEKAITAPVPAANDNDEPCAQEFVNYGLPTTNLFDPIPPRSADKDDSQSAIAAIESVFQQFSIAAHVVNQIRGPVLTQYEIKPEPGVKVEKFGAYENNLLMALRAESIRIQAPIPGRDVVGIEVPNAVRQAVTLREILEGETWRRAEKKMALPIALGKLATGGDLIVDLAEMPHLLVAGGTGSGKSVAVNDMLVGLLMCRRPEQLRLLMVDPKRVEFTFYDDLPHLLNPVIVEPKKVLFSLRWAVVEMNHRYKLLQKYGVRIIADYNRRVAQPLEGRENPTATLPYIVIVIDELADLMLTVKADIEPPITLLTQKARAAGIHLIIATQRPTTDIITGTIKANIPGRIALRVTQANDSRTILDETGAENLIGKGDMLLARGGKATVRSQAAWVSDGEIIRICEFIKNQTGPAFDDILTSKMERIKEENAGNDLDAALRDIMPESVPQEFSTLAGSEDDKSDDAYYQRALELIRQTGRFSVSAMQRRLSIGYNKAGRIADMLEDRGIIGPQIGNGAREILVDLNALATSASTGNEISDIVESAEDETAETSTDDTSASNDFNIDFDPASLEDASEIHDNP
ncbi:MAG: DNA translocase FtsK [Kiritimatiellia bacterium]